MPSTLLPIAVGTVVLFCCTPARAQCTMDTECTGDLICENGGCVDPSPAAPPVMSAPRPQTSAPKAPAPPATTPPGPLQPSTPKKPPPPELVPHSPAMMGVGVLSVAVAGVGLLSAVGNFFVGMGCGMGNIGSLGGGDCGKYEAYVVGGLLTAVVLTGVGVPLIVIGNRKEPASSKEFATASPWIGPKSAGLSLRLDL